MINYTVHGHQRILITGITGTLGRAVCKRLLENCGQYVSIMGISRDEQKQRMIPHDPRLTLRLADVRDYESLRDAIDCWEGAHFHQIYHFAALKCVDTLENQVDEALRTNVTGTKNMIKIARECFSRLILASTDKAVYPINAYGCTKAIAERLVLQASKENSVVRYGNVIGSRGSILDSLKYSLVKKRKASITDHSMTRFWWTLDEARDLVISCGYGEKYGLNYPHWIKSASTADFIAATADVLGVMSYEMEPPTGSRPGEKLHECMATEYEGGRAMYSSDPDRLMGSKELRDLISRAMKAGGL